MSIPYSERLKSEKVISRLFKTGKHVGAYPLKMVYGFKEEGEFFDAKVQFAVSAPKRNFKKAVDRNRIKRLVREAYRLNKSILKIESDTPLAIMVIYTAKTIEPYSKIESSIVKVLELLNSKIQSNAT